MARSCVVVTLDSDSKIMAWTVMVSLDLIFSTVMYRSGFLRVLLRVLINFREFRGISGAVND